MQMNRIVMVALAMAAMAVPTSVSAQSNDEVIFTSCKNDLQLSDAGCNCVLEKVHGELSAPQIVFFVAAISNDATGQQSAMSKLTSDEVLELTQFMTRTPQACSG